MGNKSSRFDQHQQSDGKMPERASMASTKKPPATTDLTTVGPNKLPIITPRQPCRLRKLKQQRTNDWLLLEREYLRNNRERIAEVDEHGLPYLMGGIHKALHATLRSNLLQEVDVERLRKRPLALCRVIELFTNDHAVVQPSDTSKQFYVPILSIVDRSKLYLNATAVCPMTGGEWPKAIVGAIAPEEDELGSTLIPQRPPPETYADVGGLEGPIQELRETVELPLTRPEVFESLGITPPRGVILYGPPGCGKTLLAKAVANATSATFIRCTGSQLVSKDPGGGPKMVRQMFELARDHAPTIVFLDEVDSIGTKRHSSGGSSSGEQEVQRTLLELLTSLDGFETRGDVKVIMATNRIETLDPALLRPGRVDRKIEIPMPDEPTRIKIFNRASRDMSLPPDVTYANVVKGVDQSNISGADITAVCTEAGLRALREHRMTLTLTDFQQAIQQVLQKKRDTLGHSQAMFL